MLIVLFSVILMILIGLVYNNAVKKRNLVIEAWHGIDIQLQRRKELLPMLAVTVKAYATYEAEVLERIAFLRIDDIEAQMEISSTISHVMAIVEKYPDLKADKSFLQLQKNIVEIEDDLRDSRRYYNGTAKNYNIFIATFPFNLVATIFGMRSRLYYE